MTTKKETVDVTVQNKLQLVQSELKAPKNQRNSFGNYNYRSCEDILEAVKPLLAKHKLALTIQDDMVEVGTRIYVRAIAKLASFDGESLEVTAFARESETKKGMDESQITGAASSYARKYALNGLFLIDDTKDADATNDHSTASKTPTKASGNALSDDRFLTALKAIQEPSKKDSVTAHLKEFTLSTTQIAQLNKVGVTL
jgi:hypothetical protein